MIDQLKHITLKGCVEPLIQELIMGQLAFSVIVMDYVKNNFLAVNGI